MNLKPELDKLPFTPVNKQLRINILSMEAACDELDMNADRKIRHDLNNVRTAIQGAVCALLDGDMQGADFLLSEAAKWINEIASRPQGGISCLDINPYQTYGR